VACSAAGCKSYGWILDIDRFALPLDCPFIQQLKGQSFSMASILASLTK
jgi:hypothetical protein